MKKIRNDVFETNSSSSHSFSVRRDVLELNFPRVIRFQLGEFHDYTDEDMDSFTGRCNYLYTCAARFDFMEEFKEMIERIMPKEVDGFKTKIYYQDYTKHDLEGLINHQCIDTAEYMIHDLLKDENLFKNFLFDDATDCVIISDCGYYDGIVDKSDNRYVMDDGASWERTKKRYGW